MKDRKLALRYARALLSSLPDPRQAEAADEFLKGLGQAMDESAEFKDFLLDPVFSRGDRKSALGALARHAGQPEQIIRFLETLVDHSRQVNLPSIAAVFHEERETAQGIVPAEITTASPLTEDLKQRALKALESVTGKKVRLSCQVEPALIGGAVTKIGSVVYDGSLRTQLSQLRRELAQE
jgi:F-type H+-transporting ATPase subunit delta